MPLKRCLNTVLKVLTESTFFIDKTFSSQLKTLTYTFFTHLLMLLKHCFNAILMLLKEDGELFKTAS